MTSPYAYPPTSNLLASVTPPGGTVRNFTYDAAGNVLTDSRAGALGMTFEYDVEGRLSKAMRTNSPGIGGTYRYDARGRLASRTVTQTAAPTTSTTLYVHDINDHIIAETDTSGAPLREYIWLEDIPLAVVDYTNGSPALYYVHADHLGRPARMTAQNQGWVWDVIYSPFGETSFIRTNPATIDIRFPGQWFQLESGLAYNWHRHYDASLGRYVQPDPLIRDSRPIIAETKKSPFLFDLEMFKSPAPAILSAARIEHVLFPDGPSRYGYVGQNPLVDVDPESLLTWRQFWMVCYSVVLEKIPGPSKTTASAAAKGRTKLSIKSAAMYPYIDWEKEPNLERLRLAYSQLAENPEKSVAMLRELASHGSIASMWYLGDAFANGVQLQKDLAQAQFWFAKADDAGWIPAPYMMGRLAFASGNHKKAFDDFSRGASMEHTPAVYRLAMMYKDGKGTNKNITAARDLLESATLNGHLFAKRELASLYISGACGATNVFTGVMMLLSLAFDLVCIGVSCTWKRDGFEERILA